MRAFIALRLSDDLKQKIIAIQSELARFDADVKWVDPSAIHLTLKFLGEITEDQAHIVEQLLTAIASGFPSFELSLAKLGAFPSLEHPKVVWIGIEDGKREVIRIAEKLDAELQNRGFAAKARTFSPHSTIGRIRSDGHQRELIKKIHALNDNVEFSGLDQSVTHQRVSSLELYQSVLTPQGPIHLLIHQVTLSGHA